jgi:hypothetical protein
MVAVDGRGMRISVDIRVLSRSKWPRDPRRGFVSARLRVRIPPRAWLCVSCECCVLSGGGLRVGMTTRPEESYRMWCAWVSSWSLDTEEVLTHYGLLRHNKNRMPIFVRKWTLQHIAAACIILPQCASNLYTSHLKWRIFYCTRLNNFGNCISSRKTNKMH